MKHFTSGTVIFECTHLVCFHKTVTLFKKTCYLQGSSFHAERQQSYNDNHSLSNTYGKPHDSI